MERDELEACLYDLGRSIRDVRYAKEFGAEYEKEHIAELTIDRAKIKAVLGILSDSRCHIALFEEKCYRQDDGTWWKRKYELPAYCSGNTIYYAELTVSLLVDGMEGRVEIKKGDVALDLRRMPEDDESDREAPDKPREIKYLAPEHKLDREENDKFLKFLRESGVNLEPEKEPPHE